MAADAVGYSRMMGADETGTLTRLRSVQAQVFKPAVARHNGRMVKEMGDGLLVEFASVVDAVQCAVAIQQALNRRNADSEDGDALRFRIGINLGDVIADGDDVFGDGVNVAARLEGKAEPGGIVVSDDAYRQVRNKLPFGFEDLGEFNLKNIAEPVRIYRCTPEGGVGDKPTSDRRAERPTLAVLPFENMSEDPEQLYFSDGMTDDIITDLSRYRELFVIGRHSAFGFRDRARDTAAVARALGVQFIVHGSVRRAGPRIRVTAALIDAIAGNQLWAERYDRELNDVFAVQDEITGLIVNTLAGEIERQHRQRAVSKAFDSADAYDHTLRALALLWKVEPDGNRKAMAEAERAVSLDPGFSRAHAMLAWAYITEGSNLWADDPSSAFQKAHDAAMAAIAADSKDPWAHLALGWVQIWRDRAHEHSLDSLARALQLNPSSGHFHAMYSWGLGWSGRYAAALEEAETAMRLDPHYPALYLVFMCRALFGLQRYDEAIEPIGRAVAAMPRHANCLTLATACHAAMGQTEIARDYCRGLQEVSPDITLDSIKTTLPMAQSADLDHFLSLLKAAGLPG